MRRFTLLTIVLTILPLCFSRASEAPLATWNPAAPSPFQTSPAMAELLKDYRRSWVRLTALEPSALHWNQRVVVYINKHAEVYAHNHTAYRESLADDDQEQHRFKPYPHGTVLLKENYRVDARGTLQPASVTMMMKYANDQDPTMGDWHFVQFDPHGKVLINGNHENPGVHVVCASCHQSMARRDYVFATLYAPQKSAP